MGQHHFAKYRGHKVITADGVIHLDGAVKSSIRVDGFTFQVKRTSHGYQTDPRWTLGRAGFVTSVSMICAYSRALLSAYLHMAIVDVKYPKHTEWYR
jgi:hypothetical protein